MTSRVLGLVRDQVLASMFGAGNAMDAFNVAFRIPNLVRDLFAEGAMSAAFVPVFMRQHSPESRLIEAIERPDAQDQNAPRAILRAFPEAASFVNR